jgi:hypothetical protein
MDRRIAALALPPIVAVVATFGFIAAESRGAAVLSYGPVRNIAEAAGLGSAAEVTRLLTKAQDPAQVMPIRSEIISSSVRHASALEAAIWSRRVELVKLLIVRARISADERNRLACLARDLSASDIAEFLDPGVDATCVSGLVMQSIQARGGESGVSP